MAMLASIATGPPAGSGRKPPWLEATDIWLRDAAPAVALAVNSAGGATVKTVVLISPEEMDAAGKNNIPPGSFQCPGFYERLRRTPLATDLRVSKTPAPFTATASKAG